MAFVFCLCVCRCVSGERGQSGAAGRGAEPPAEQPAAAGRVAEHGGSSHQSHRAAVQRQQALLATATTCTDTPSAERHMRAVQHDCTLSTLTLFVTYCKSRHTRILFKLSYRSLNPGSWSCLMVREYANRLI